MTKHTNWKDSKAKQHIQQLFETGKLNPDNLPELKNLYTSRPDLFEAFKLKNFRVNVKNLAKSYREKFAYLSENEIVPNVLCSKVKSSLCTPEPNSFCTPFCTPV